MDKNEIEKGRAELQEIIESLPTSRINQIIEEQGWDQDSIMLLAYSFMEKNNLLPQFEKYLEETQKEENEYTVE